MSQVNHLIYEREIISDETSFGKNKIEVVKLMNTQWIYDSPGANLILVPSIIKIYYQAIVI